MNEKKKPIVLADEEKNLDLYISEKKVLKYLSLLHLVIQAFDASKLSTKLIIAFVILGSMWIFQGLTLPN